MSSTGRGPRLGGPDDFYETPAWCVNRLLDVWKPREGYLMEPAAGHAAIIRAFNDAIGLLDWWGVDCRATAAEEIGGAGATGVIADFLKWEPQSDGLDTSIIKTVITNPPFAYCEEFIRRSAALFPDADLVFLVRLGFLASEGRVQLWHDMGHPDVYVLPNRPSFTPDGKTDSADYCWIVLPWHDNRDEGVFRVLKPTPVEERRGKRKRARVEASGQRYGEEAGCTSK